MLYDGGAKNLEEKVFVGLFLLPKAACFELQLWPGADRDQDDAVSFGLLQRSLQAFAGKGDAIDINGAVLEDEGLRMAGVDPRLAILGVPGARGLGQLSRAPFQDVLTRIA